MNSGELYHLTTERFQKFLEKQGKVYTQEREVILRTICELKGPFDSATLVAAVKAQRITRATVYNTIPLMTESGVLRRISRQAGQRRNLYELIWGSTNRMQIICRRCGRVSEFREVAIENIAISRKYSNFLMERFSMVVYGTCKTCRRKT